MWVLGTESKLSARELLLLKLIHLFSPPPHTLESANRPGWLMARPQQSFCLCSFTTGITSMYHHSCLFYMGPRDHTEVFMLLWQTLCQLSSRSRVSQAPLLNEGVSVSSCKIARGGERYYWRIKPHHSHKSRWPQCPDGHIYFYLSCKFYDLMAIGRGSFAPNSLDLFLVAKIMQPCAMMARHLYIGLKLDSTFCLVLLTPDGASEHRNSQCCCWL